MNEVHDLTTGELQPRLRATEVSPIEMVERTVVASIGAAAPSWCERLWETGLRKLQTAELDSDERSAFACRWLAWELGRRSCAFHPS